MKKNAQRIEKPFTIEQLVAAMDALGVYSGENTEAEHRAEAERLGSMKVYQMILANAFLGMVEGNTLLADSSGVTAEHMHTAHQQALKSAGVKNNPGKLLHFLRWKILRVAGPLREIAQNQEVGPLPLSAAHAAEALQLLLGVCATGQNLATAQPRQMTADLKAAREALTCALDNLDIMVRLLGKVEDLS